LPLPTILALSAPIIQEPKFDIGHSPADNVVECDGFRRQKEGAQVPALLNFRNQLTCPGEMGMQPDKWARAWRFPLVRGRADERRIPAPARDFLASFGLPRIVIFEWRSAFEITFTPIERELVAYNTVITWGDFYDASRDRDWSHQLIIGEEEFCNGHASFCVDERDGSVNRLDCELHKRPKCFVNADIELFGRSLLLAQKWSDAVHANGALPSIEAFKILASELRNTDSRAFDDEWNFWPSLIEYVLDDPDGDPPALEITSDPTRSKPRF
jgi:hypothetical protein